MQFPRLFIFIITIHLYQGQAFSAVDFPLENDQIAASLASVLDPYVPDDVEQGEYISATDLRKYGNVKKLFLRSHIALVFDERDNEFIYTKSANKIVPIASISKLMMAMVILDANLPMREVITINKKDKDRILYAKSRLSFGSKFSRYDLLLIAILASENRAAAALARSYPGGSIIFVKHMNKKAKALGLKNTRFYDPAGLHKNNVSTAKELIKLVQAASNYLLIREFSTLTDTSVEELSSGRHISFLNTNRLVRNAQWNINLSKTGFTNNAGNCLVMKVDIEGRPLVIVLLNSWGKLSKYGDSNRIKHWILTTEDSIKRRSNRILESDTHHSVISFHK